MTSTQLQVQETLAGYGELTRASINAYLMGGEPSTYLYDLIRDYPLRGGKAIRPALLLATCQAFGGTLRAGLAPAIALELLHSAFLIHDDIEDASTQRRGRPTLHRLHGLDMAMNAGDALACLAIRPIHEDRALSPRLSEMLISEFLAVVKETTEGQALDLGWRQHNVVDLVPADYLLQAVKKTCWYTTMGPIRMGALVGTKGATTALRALTRFGLYLGIAFQIRDDLMNIEAGSDQGKDVRSDIREGKRTLMMIHALGNSTGSDRAWLVDYLADPGSKWTEQVEERIELMMRACGSIEFTRQYSVGILSAATEAFSEAFADQPASEHKDFVAGLIPFVVDRGV